jgi:FkbM family methyltransferase
MGKSKLKLKHIHEKLKFVGGSLKHEFPEQLMSVKFIHPNAKVLEIGSNIGRNTLVIASLLKSSKNLLTLETSSESANILTQNRDINKFKFQIINAALSKTPLFQQSWKCLPLGHTDLKQGVWTPVTIIDYSSIVASFGHPDTLVADCEGSLYYIFQDFPEILDDVKLILMENDFLDIDHKIFVDDCLKNKGFTRIYVKSGSIDNSLPCKDYFFEAWSKHT